ncbi:hypothetical protein BCR36DRAFT_407310 [Piromyces finnis]|uniref:Brl1/Brr6 domain-containing protein n=1 Tax=Piromyces finnis TaxID=1754191 RepID=A0A1Y1UVB1_9FUNG|nr:hypothetical protein BCR36DRAFT_407310 [Piromyces finnis]|eukprot:ORX41891.1 hypothetical protein BCR36DRAFT_407310 [Piromyces finnis]
MFVRYPYQRDNYYRSRIAPMEVDREESPIWAIQAKKKPTRIGENEMRNSKISSKKGLFKLKKRNKDYKKEDEESNKHSQTKLVKYSQKNTKRNKYGGETKEQTTKYVDDFESESDYDEDESEIDNQMSIEYQHPNKILRPIIYNNPYSFEEQNTKNSKTTVLKDSSFPQLLSSYSKFLFNVLLLSVALWIIFNFIKTVRTDMNIKYNEYVMNNMKDISKCYDNYKTNKCYSDERIPFLENTCREWEACMNQNPDEIRIIMIAAEVISEILDKFIEPLSMKTTVVVALVSVICFFIIWKMGGDPTNINKKSKKSQIKSNQTNQECMQVGMCPPQTVDSGFISNGDIMYPIAPAAAIYPGNPSYPIPVTYPQVYSYPVYPPVYQNDHDIHYFTQSNPKFRNAPQNIQPRSQPIKKNYKFVKSAHNRDPYQSRFKTNRSSYYPRQRSRERYYYEEEDDRNDDQYDMEEDDSYFDEDYGY